MQSAHHLDIKGFQRVAGGLDEVDTCMYTVIYDVHPVHLVLGLEVRIETLLDVLDNWAPGVVVINEISKAGGVYHRQSETNTILLDISTDRLDRYCRGNDVLGRTLPFLWRVQGGVKERVDKG
jgi:hypothetical protein